MAPSLHATLAGLAATAGAVLIGRQLDQKYSIRSDLAQISAGKKSMKYYDRICELYGEDDWSFYNVLHQTHGKNDYDEAFLFEDRSWTYAEVRAEVGRLALELQRLGIRNRTVVGMFINNSPEFFFLWWALFKIGAIPAPLNTSISQQPFKHCLKVSSAEYLMCTFELYHSLANTLDFEKQGTLADGVYSNADLPDLRLISIYDYGTYTPSQAHPDVTIITQTQLAPTTYEMAEWPKEQRPKLGPNDFSQYLFTSGTTGLPKASFFPTLFGHMAANPKRWPVMFEKPRRAYICTPMFHGGATYALLPSTVGSGGTVILARRFSVRNFWHDVRRTKANMLFYIGEMARYLVEAPPDLVHQDETKTHGLEVLYGMGIAAPVWRALKTRFGIPWIAEYYGATEGTVILTNSHHSGEDGVGKVSHWGPIMRYLNDGFYIIKVDMESGEVIRDPKTGFCIQAGWDEVGEAINRIQPPLRRSHDYVGEGGQEATEKKQLRDVFKKGDLFVRLGDALSMNRKGYVAFHDRLGDTYRAKGHNISTAEVEDAFAKHPEIASSNVYAIRMTEYGYDGQLGCAAVTIRGSASEEGPSSVEGEVMQNLEDFLQTKGGLPSYAVPRFVRVLVGADEKVSPQSKHSELGQDAGDEYMSPILKKLKTDLRREAFSPPPESPDRMYWIEREGRGFVLLDSEKQEHLLRGKARL